MPQTSCIVSEAHVVLSSNVLISVSVISLSVISPGDAMDNNHILKNALLATQRKGASGVAAAVVVPGLLNINSKAGAAKMKKSKKYWRNDGKKDGKKDEGDDRNDDLAVQSGSHMEKALNMLYEHEMAHNHTMRTCTTHVHEGAGK